MDTLYSHSQNAIIIVAVSGSRKNNKKNNNNKNKKLTDFPSSQRDARANTHAQQHTQREVRATTVLFHLPPSTRLSPSLSHTHSLTLCMQQRIKSSRRKRYRGKTRWIVFLCVTVIFKKKIKNCAFTLGQRGWLDAVGMRESRAPGRRA